MGIPGPRFRMSVGIPDPGFGGVWESQVWGVYGNPRSRVWGIHGDPGFVVSMGIPGLGGVWEPQVWGARAPLIPPCVPQCSWCRDSTAGSRASPTPSRSSIPSTTSRQVRAGTVLSPPLPAFPPWTDTHPSELSFCSSPLHSVLFLLLL